MARTTLAIEPSILRELKLRAARQGTSLQQVANDVLRQALAMPAPQFRLQLGSWSGMQHPGVDLFDRNSLFDFMEEKTD